MSIGRSQHLDELMVEDFIIQPKMTKSGSKLSYFRNSYLKFETIINSLTLSSAY